MSYLKKHEHGDTADFVMMGLPIDEVLLVVDDLKKEGKVTGNRKENA